MSFTLKAKIKLSARINCFHICSVIFQIGICMCPASQVKRRPSAARLLPAPTQMALCLRPCLLRLLRRELLRAFATLDDSTPQCRISELRVWSYEPFIVFASSSSGYTSGQNCLACKVFTTVCSSSDLVGSVSSLCVWRCGHLLVF